MAHMTKQHQLLIGILHFLHESEALKTELRHSWLSDGRRESVAEHTWRMALMAIVLHNEVDHSVDIGRLLKMIIVHDLGEVYVGDYQMYGKAVPKNKHELEAKAMQKLVTTLPSYSQAEILELWQEFEEHQSPTAKFAVALDKLEVIIQHNEADVSTYLEGEGLFNLNYANDKFTYNHALSELREIAREETKEKISA